MVRRSCSAGPHAFQLNAGKMLEMLGQIQTESRILAMTAEAVPFHPDGGSRLRRLRHGPGQFRRSRRQFQRRLLAAGGIRPAGRCDGLAGQRRQRVMPSGDLATQIRAVLISSYPI